MSKTRIKIKAIFESEYDVNPEYYPEGATIQEMINIDIEGAKDDPLMFIENANLRTFTGEIVKQ